jgi:elongation factor Tu
LFLLTAREGGRAKPIRNGYRPVFFFGGTDATGSLELELDLAPGAHGPVRFVLDRPVAIEPGVRFALREGGRTIGAGVVTAIE